MNKERLKDAIIAVLVGAVISFIGTLLQGLLDVLHQVDAPMAAGVIGALKYATRHLV